MKDMQALGLLTQAYILLLQMPHSGVRARNQDVLCALRDAIVKETGASAQQVQDHFEAAALQRRVAA